MNKKVLSFVLSSTMVFASVATAFAATGDVLNTDGSLFASGKQMNVSQSLQKQVNSQQSKYLYEYEGKNYTMGDANSAYATGGSDMDNFAEEIAKKDPVSDVTGELAIKDVVAVTTTKLQVSFNKAVDQVTAENFSIPGVTVQIATLSENKTTVTLTVAGAVVKESYILNVTGLESNGVPAENMTKGFVMPSAEDLFKPVLTIDKEEMASDGASQALVQFELRDAEGVVLADAENVTVNFISPLGNFAEKTVAVEKGVAKCLFISEFLDSSKVVPIYAVISEAADKNLIGVSADTTVIMTPNPGEGGEETLGASMTKAEANQADRIVVWFNKDVSKSVLSEFDVTVKTNVNNDRTGGDNVTVAGIIALPGNAKALQVLLDVENGAFLTDNANVLVGCTDKNGTIDVKSGEQFFVLTDARVPAMQKAVAEDLKTLKVLFSEPIDSTTAAIESNWVIDGKVLNSADWGATTSATAIVGTFDKITGRDNRNVVTITLGTDKTGKQIYFKGGKHTVQGSNIGDWAYNTDKTNVMNTQTLDFTVTVDSSKPTATVEVMSPEQWLVTFDKSVNITNVGLFELQKKKTDSDEFALVTKGALAMADDTSLDIVVTSLPDSNGKAYLVETDYDWTAVYDTATTKKNYFNDSYRLRIAEGKVTSPATGQKNDEILLPLGGVMLTPDVTSPVINDIVQEDLSTQAYDVQMSEPVKLVGGANNEGATLAQGQTTISAVTAEFIKEDNSKTIQATVDNTQFMDDYDKVLSVTPNDTLEAGAWMLVVRDVTDDIGNKAATATKVFKVEGTGPVKSDFAVLFAAADGNNDISDGHNLVATSADAIYVKFTKPVSTVGEQKNALSTANYTVNGQKLPQGTKIVANIEGFDDRDNVTDSITILLPDRTIQSVETTVINIGNYIESADGEKLKNSGEKRLSYEYDGFTGIIDAVGAAAASTALGVIEDFNITAGAIVASADAIDLAPAIAGVTVSAIKIDASAEGAEYLTTAGGGVQLALTKTNDVTEDIYVPVTVEVVYYDATTETTQKVNVIIDVILKS